MRLIITKNFSENTLTLLRKCGYHYTGDYKGEPGFARRTGRSEFPKFHIYINKDTHEELVLNLHFDAKRPSYSGTSMHAGEYDTEIIREEAARIQGIIMSLS